jgi:hypothetical protein
VILVPGVQLRAHLSLQHRAVRFGHLLQFAIERAVDDVSPFHLGSLVAVILHREGRRNPDKNDEQLERYFRQHAAKRITPGRSALRSRLARRRCRRSLAHRTTIS